MPRSRMNLALSLALFAPALPAGPGEVVPVRRGTARATIERKGTLVPAEAAEVSLWLEGYRDELLVLEAVPHGSPVGEGDVLVRLDLRKIDEQLKQAEFDLAQAELKLRHSEEEARLGEEASRAEMLRAEKDNEWAQRRLQGFLEHEREHRKERERLTTQGEEHGLEDQRDELAQLERMYKEDELVDATEEIVLKRSRRSLARYQANVDLGRRIRAYSRDYAEAISQEGLELDAAQKAGALERQRRSTEIKRAAKRLELDKARLELEKQKMSLERLRRDREQMVVRAPRRGILLHGKPDAAPGTGKLERGSTLKLREVFLTVAEPGSLKVVTDVPEAEVLRAKPGTAAETVPVALPDLAWTGGIRVALLPTSRKDGENLYETTLAPGKSDPRMRAGMQCKVRIILEEVRDALLVPGAAVQKKGEQAFVRAGKSREGPFEERAVALGCVDGKDVVVKEGLSEGEFVELRGAGEK